MEKNKKLIASILIGTALLIGGIMGYGQWKKNKSTGGLNIESGFPLKMGSRGENVKKLQRYLNNKMPSPMKRLEIDGIFGELTEKALLAVANKNEINEREFNKLT
jgi:hypothetical protein